MHAALLQMTASDDPHENIEMVQAAIAEAKAAGADIVLTPEVTNCLSASRTRQAEVLRDEAEDSMLAAVRGAGIWVLLGSIAVRTDDPAGRFANRSILLDPEGNIAARYDKIHMFDVAVSEAETYRESAGYRPGDLAVVASTPLGALGLTICYDLRFPSLYRDLAQAGAEMLTVPSAFSTATGPAHWEPLLRARAIETGCWVLAPAQTGTHRATRGRTRRTHGHSMVIDPWGRVIADAGTEPGLIHADLDLGLVAETRRRVPSLGHDRRYRRPA